MKKIKLFEVIGINYCDCTTLYDIKSESDWHEVSDSDYQLLCNNLNKKFVIIEEQTNKIPLIINDIIEKIKKEQDRQKEIEKQKNERIKKSIQTKKLKAIEKAKKILSENNL